MKWEEKSMKCRMAANIRWARDRMKELFLTPVEFYNEKNSYLKRRWDRASAHRDDYKLEKITVPGKYREIEAIKVTNIRRGTVYLVRFYYEPGRKSGLGACTCPDFRDRGCRYHLPCKHILMSLRSENDKDS